MTIATRLKMLFGVCAFALSLTGCAKTSATTPAAPVVGNSTAAQIGSAMGKAGAVIGGFQNAVHAANTQTPKLIPDTTALSLLQICDKLNQAGLQVDAITRSYATVPAGGNSQIAAIITPLLAAVNDALSNGLLTITDANTKAAAQTALTTIQAGLVIVQQIVGG